ncbi:MAG TPA: hypothetical protein VGS62_06170 [Streptosporangiaceae bacterium]|nr:hypothetical protein [Streptosporangiaceae bacterium]
MTEASLRTGGEGFVSVVPMVDSTGGKLVTGLESQARGPGLDDSAFREVRPRIEEPLVLDAAEGISDVHQLTRLVRRVAGRWVNESYRRRPRIIPVLVEV